MIQINISLNDTSPVVIGDKTQIRQVIMNLVINASESIVEKNGIISISTGLSKLTAKELDKMLFHDKTIEGEYGWIAVRDNGCGMKKETLNKIFEPFFTTKFTGRGLGMSAVLGFVRSHNGAIEVESELGKGSAFKVYLPVSSMEDQAVNNKIDTCIDPKTKKINSEFIGSGTILLIDDEESVRNLAKKFIAEAGFSFIEANNGEDALDVYRKENMNILLVVLDLTMPKMSGEETLLELNKINPKVKILLSSGYSEKEVASRFAGKGASGFLQKPYTYLEFVEKVCEVLLPEV
jgi:CheY-like chemotaxis protein